MTGREQSHERGHCPRQSRAPQSELDKFGLITDQSTVQRKGTEVALGKLRSGDIVGGVPMGYLERTDGGFCAPLIGSLCLRQVDAVVALHTVMCVVHRAAPLSLCYIPTEIVMLCKSSVREVRK